ncbi:hypothetical protein BIW11_04787 [Tropilaelaps mercedesae]|uniref:Uncharacterized protein n=1 Tax=Tropilaelaps mercedesae TaxID=418985 RepID=A0A1V9X1S4_9ACAR|nr:hypothetical protein BIW11_04787 [Tropilaelaps mercedesae]
MVVRQRREILLQESWREEIKDYPDWMSCFNQNSNIKLRTRVSRCAGCLRT